MPDHDLNRPMELSSVLVLPAAEQPALESALQDIPNLELRRASTLADALASIARAAPSAIILAGTPPDCTPIGTFLILHAEASGVPILIVNDQHGTASVETLLQHGAEDVIYADELTPGRVRRAIHHAIVRHARLEKDRTEYRTLRYAAASRLAAVEHRAQQLALSRQTVMNQARLLEAILSSLGEGVMVANSDGRFLMVNPAAQRVFRLRAGMRVTPGASTRWGVYRPDRTTLVPYDELPLLQAMEGRSMDNVEVYVRNRQVPDGVWLNAAARPLVDARGKVRGGVLVFRDLTEHKRMQQMLLRREQELHETRKIEALGRLAGGVAHDFNNLVAGIRGMGQNLCESLSQGDPRHADAVEIVQAAERAFAVTQQLLAFGRRQPIQPKVISVNQVITNVHRLLQQVVGEDVQIHLLLSDVGNIRMDPGSLEQLLMNLVVNARDAMPRGGEVAVETSRVDINEQTARSLFALQPGPHVMLRVTDRGCGMDQELLSHIFEPFFTTKERGHGTGLGLATVYGIVKQSGGAITVNSQPGEGTTFRVYFPIVAAEPTVEPSMPPRAAPLTGTEHILVVEDEDIVRRVVVRALKNRGYTVSVARDGEEALTIARQGEKLDLVVSDVIMPKMNGPAVVKGIREHHPKIAVLYMSGYPEDVITHRGVLEPGIEFIEKGSLTPHLLDKVREVLDKRTAVPAAK
jgi:two-component system cell cycle sensor histidine kinase/response regulator CckA